MKLRGAFNPKLQVALGFAMIAVTGHILWFLSTADWAALDLRIAPLAFLLGLAAGVPIGFSRFKVLKEVLPEVDGQFYLTEKPVVGKTRQGANLLYLQRFCFGGAFLAWFMLTTYTHGKFLLYGCMAAFILGSYLSGQTLPFIRLWLYLTRAPRSPGGQQ